MWRALFYMYLIKVKCQLSLMTKKDLIPTKIFIILMDYKNLNAATRKDHCLISFIDQKLERLEGQECFYFLDEYSAITRSLIF